MEMIPSFSEIKKRLDLIAIQNDLAHKLKVERIRPKSDLLRLLEAGKKTYKELRVFFNRR